MLDNTSNKTSKFRTKYWVEINDESRETYNNSQIRFKTWPSSNCTSKISNTETDYTKDLDVVMSMYNLIE